MTEVKETPTPHVGLFRSWINLKKIPLIQLQIS